MDELKATKENIDKMLLKQTVYLLSDSEDICNGDYVDIVHKVKELGFSFDKNRVLHHIHYGSNGVEMVLNGKKFSLWNGNTKRFSITRLT